MLSGCVTFCWRRVFVFQCLFSRSTIRLFQPIQVQTCHGCFNHDIVADLCYELLTRLNNFIGSSSIEQTGKSFRHYRESNPGLLDHESSLTTRPRLWLCTVRGWLDVRERERQKVIKRPKNRIVAIIRLNE